MEVLEACVKVEVDGSGESLSGDESNNDTDLQYDDNQISATKKRRLQDNREKEKNMEGKYNITNSGSEEEDQFDNNSDDSNIVEKQSSDVKKCRKRTKKEKRKSNDIVLPGANQAWADAMAKVLQISNKKHLILAKAKKDRDIKITDIKKTKDNIEIIDEKGQIVEKKTEKSDDKDENDRRKKKQLLLEKKQKKLLWHNMARTKPYISDKEKERMLSRAATRGVVQLFNAVQQHQKTLGEKLKAAGNSEVKKEKVLKSFTKGGFLDMLKGEKKRVLESNKNDTVGDKKTWDALRDDFMMGAHLKDWDKDSDDD